MILLLYTVASIYEVAPHSTKNVLSQSWDKKHVKKCPSRPDLCPEVNIFLGQVFVLETPIKDRKHFSLDIFLEKNVLCGLLVPP